MRPFWLLLAVALPAHADLYRWIDPATGSVKFSSLPPQDSRIEAEVVRYNPPSSPKPPAVVPVPGAAAQSASHPMSGATVPELETRWRSLLTQLTGLSPQEFRQGSEGLRQHIDAYETVRAELDRQDPAGAARRNAETAGLFERLRQGFGAQLPSAPR